MPPKIAKAADKSLDRNHALLFKQVLQHYEQKEYKKGVKTADTILKKYPTHGETMAMKGLILTNMDKKEEGWECVRKGLRNDLKSHICWHVYGLLYRADRNYEESMKCYLNALKYDPDNLVVLRDLAVIQSQLRIYPGLIETRRNLMVRQPDIRGQHTAYAVAYHLDGDYTNALKILAEYDEKLLVKPKHNAEHSLTTLYYNTILAESGDYKKALLHLDLVEIQILDKLEVLERRARYNSKLGNSQVSAELYRQLLDINPDCHRYYAGLEVALGYRTDSSIKNEQTQQASETYSELQKLYPKASAPRRRPLDWLSGDDFQQAADKYLRHLLQKGVPSTFVDIKALYDSQSKADTIENLALSYLTEFKQTTVLDANGSSHENGQVAVPAEAPTSYLWTLYFLAQSYDHRRKLQQAIETIDKAIDHTPTLVELHLTKARILKHCGSPSLAAEQMNVARELDLQDRFINTKSTKYYLRADLNAEAMNTISLFVNSTLGGGSIGDLQEMQSINFIVEDGLSYLRQSLHGLALKRFESVKKAVDQWYEDEFDFHQYCFRKGTIDAYVESMRWEDSVYTHSVYKRAAAGAIRALLDLHRVPALKQGPLESSHLSDADKKKEKKRIQKVRARCSKDATKEADKKDGVDMHRKIDLDPVGDKLISTTTPLEDALVYLNPWLHDSPRDATALLLASEVYIEQGALEKAVEMLSQIPDQDTHFLIYNLHQRSESSDSPSSKVTEYITTQLDGQSCKDWNSQFLKQASTASDFLSGIKVAKALNVPVQDTILGWNLDMRHTTFAQVKELWALLKSTSTEEAELKRFEEKVKEVWTLAEL
ncbi:protein of unknown function [Taphrina deformans PYCC 5710]|uniref:Uncharacterized protein n=1 Tax=Taphrina deformans (strain PYCC 5710 / ATCC 11124 / CBS 356.35 / IMI 108563 / JCM 9778 / NBRC 8474) TaxID=1097556 RepID=R4XHT7_TAPDE|nr:protein of unknown function [Taphrina deformans PYCC 5710]|eukprot:CCG84078.1 protein of unknown function [Taphrina deformans PYCC 5710]